MRGRVPQQFNREGVRLAPRHGAVEYGAVGEAEPDPPVVGERCGVVLHQSEDRADSPRFTPVACIHSPRISANSDTGFARSAAIASSETPAALSMATPSRASASSSLPSTRSISTPAGIFVAASAAGGSSYSLPSWANR